MTNRQAVVVSEEVTAALAGGRPVVALESTIISHGLPRPRNLEVARGLEELLRGAGVVPATVGVIGGRPTIGVDAGGIELLASGSDIVKTGVRDLPLIAAKRLHAATTVAATAYLARSAGIRVFATGGLGGVHRGASVTFDESADLTTLARTPITVVSAGVKSILDVPATLERLETLGVTVAGYRTKRFPGFFVADSGCEVEWSIESSGEIAEAMRAADELGLVGAILIANPVGPDEQLDPAVHARVLDEALRAAEAAGVRGKATTPFLLEHVTTATHGASLEANVAAVRGNVALAGEIAKAWAEASGE